jgi:hypothetical protein
MIYFIRAGLSGPVKIGRADDPQSRIEYLQTGHYEELTLVRCIDGSMMEERWLHQEYAALRIRGEWFHYDAAMMSVVPPDNLSPALLAERANGPIFVFNANPSDNAAFRASVEGALVRHGMAYTTFGMKALGDPGFVTALRKGRSPTLHTIARVHAFIASLEKSDAA